MEYKFTDDNFKEEVTDAKGLVLVDFYADWCGPCKMMAPFIEEIATDYEGKVKVGKLNVDEAQDTASKFNIMSIPTVVLFKDGEKIDQFTGARSKADIASFIDNNL